VEAVIEEAEAVVIEEVQVVAVEEEAADKVEEVEVVKEVAVAQEDKEVKILIEAKIKKTRN
jgi:hypothetical protein